MSNFRLIFTLPVHVVGCMMVMFLELIRFRISGVVAILKALYWNVVHIQFTLEKRRVIQKRRKISDSEILSYVCTPFSIRYTVNKLLGYIGR